MPDAPFIGLLAAAFFAGLIDAVAGGGGLISLPALLAAGLPPQVALGTNKFQSMMGTACALANFHRKAKVLWRVAAVGIPFALAGSVLGARLAVLVSPELLGRILVVLLPPAALLVFSSRALARRSKAPLAEGAWFWFIAATVCGGVGFYDGFFGPGTGTFFIIALVLFVRLPLVNASATAKTFNLASNAGAFATFIAAGAIAWQVAAAMAVANIAGNLIGSHYAVERGGPLIRRALVLSFSLLFAYLVWKSFSR